MECLVRNRVFNSFKILPPTKHLLLTEGKSNFTVKFYSIPLIKWSKLTSPVTKQIKITCYLIGYNENRWLLWYFFERYNLTLIMKCIRHSQIDRHLQNNWPVIFKSVQIMKVKEKLSKCSRLKIKRHALKLVPFATKDITGTNESQLPHLWIMREN